MLTDGTITLRALKESDKKQVAVLLNNRRITCNLRDIIPFPYTEEDAAFFINFNKDQNPVLVFGIIYNNTCCGVISLIAQQDVYRKSAEIGYWLGEPFWNKGILTASVRLITDYGFNQLDFIRIFAGVFEYNIPSMKVLEKNGFKKEGVFERSIFKNGQVWDEHRYAKLK
ncbi:MAG: GNAT family protein [Chitinophagaceae bacterium]